MCAHVFLKDFDVGFIDSVPVNLLIPTKKILGLYPKSRDIPLQASAVLRSGSMLYEPCAGMTILGAVTSKTSSRRRPGSSVFCDAPADFYNRGFKYEVQHGLKIHETPGVGF
ncbi:hypothetical protein MCEGEM3_00002 [Oxalobacteraceae bacterium]